jgi:hypothetical protein
VFLQDAIDDISRTSGIAKLKSSIEYRLLKHGRKYIRMMLAINDGADDYPDTDGEGREAEPSSIACKPLRSVAIGQALDKYSTPTKLRKEPMLVPPTPLDLEIQEIELIDLVGDSDEESEGYETDDGEIEILSRNPARQVASHGVIDLVSSSEDEGREEEQSPGAGSPCSEGEVEAQLGSISRSEGKGPGGRRKPVT